jgi:catechol 2,3-dioxygenase
MSSALTTKTPARKPALLAAQTRLGGVVLTVTDLERALDFYTRVIGLAVHRREEGFAALGVGGEDIVTLNEDPGATAPGRDAGIYHFALLFASREELARAAVRIATARAAIDGASDHGTHEANYLPDPDGIGIELAADRPREQWPPSLYDDFLSNGPAPLDLQGLLARVAGEQPSERAGGGLAIGHIHLHVGALDAATRFYRDGLGFEVMGELPSAVFVAAGGYHHHVAFNIWRGRGAAPARADAIGLRHWTLILESDEELTAIPRRLTALGVVVEDRPDGVIARDPSNIAVLIRR